MISSVLKDIFCKCLKFVIDKTAILLMLKEFLYAKLVSRILQSFLGSDTFLLNWYCFFKWLSEPYLVIRLLQKIVNIARVCIFKTSCRLLTLIFGFWYIFTKVTWTFYLAKATLPNHFSIVKCFMNVIRVCIFKTVYELLAIIFWVGLLFM